MMKYTYARTEEEKTNDILMYRIKARAGAIAEKYEKTKKRTDLATLAGAVVFAAIAAPFLYKAYDTENVPAMILIALGTILLTVIARLTVGAILSHSLFVFVKWGALCSKWTAARKEMHDYEAKLAEHKVFEEDLKKVEKNLMDTSEKLIAFAEKNGINVDN